MSTPPACSRTDVCVHRSTAPRPKQHGSPSANIGARIVDTLRDHRAWLRPFCQAGVLRLSATGACDCYVPVMTYLYTFDRSRRVQSPSRRRGLLYLRETIPRCCSWASPRDLFLALLTRADALASQHAGAGCDLDQSPMSAKGQKLTCGPSSSCSASCQ
jgi:hypothetical protein